MQIYLVENMEYWGVSMRNLYLDTKKKIYRTTAILFVVQLFGALGAGFFFVIQNIFGTYHMLGATESVNEPILWFILFWATDFFFIALGVILSYQIAGIPAIAPSLALSVYFCHFNVASLSAEEMYACFFSTPQNYQKSTAIGYMGYLVMALVLSLLIKYLYIGWTNLKDKIGSGLDKQILKLRRKIKAIPETLKGIEIIEGVDLIVMILIIPVASAALTFILIKYGIEAPFGALAGKLGEALTAMASENIVLCALVIGLMVGFDLVGPLSYSAFAVCTAAYLTTGNAQLVTIYSVCFITVGWTAFFSVLCNKIFKKGGKSDTDDFNMTVSGPINAFFENIKLTTLFSMPYAYRSPLTTIPGYMVGSAVGGVVTALLKIVNTAYTDGSFPRYTIDKYTYGGVNLTYGDMFQKGDLYMSFTLPLRSGDWLTCRIPLFLIILASAFMGGLVIMALKEIEYKILSKRNCCYEAKGDMVIEIREYGKKLAKEIKK